MNAITPFKFESNEVRIVTVDGDPWFVAKDVAEALALQWFGSKTIAHVPEEWKGVGSDPTIKGEREMLTLSEQGLYFFLGRSDKPKALPFQKWIAGQVLPSIRKTGQYQRPQQPDKPVNAEIQCMFALDFQDLNIQVRGVRDHDGDYWFNARDVCRAIGYSPSAADTYQALSRHVEARFTKNIDVPTISGDQPVKHIDINGIVAITNSSKKRGAAPFRAWFDHHALPSIRSGAIQIVHPPRQSKATVPALSQINPEDAPLIAGKSTRLILAEQTSQLEKLAAIMEGMATQTAMPVPIHIPFEAALPNTKDHWVTYANTVGDPNWKDPLWALLIHLEGLGCNVDGAKAALRCRDMLTTDACRVARGWGAHNPKIDLRKWHTEGQQRAVKMGGVGFGIRPR
ncbi:MAG: hypothetical protein HQL97_01165 [Magnetococcales bacterium]|nr:hypothetical protein [Magnetococcales bacterium]